MASKSHSTHQDLATVRGYIRNSLPTQRMAELHFPAADAHEALGRLEEQVQTLQLERDRAVHILECADTPLMRDVLAERDRLAEQYERAEHENQSAHARIAELEEQLEAALDALDKGKRFERAYQESLGATWTLPQKERLDSLQSAFLDAYLTVESSPASEPSDA